MLTYVLTLLAAPAAAVPVSAVMPGTYTNEEETYFDKDAKRTPAPWIGIIVDAAGKVAFVDVSGKPVPAVAYVALAPSDKPGSRADDACRRTRDRIAARSHRDMLGRGPQSREEARWQ